MSRAKRRKRGRRVRGGSLVLISMLLVGSATLRIGVQAGPSLTREMSKPSEHNVELENQMQPVEPTMAGLQHLVTALKNREEQLNKREMQIEDRMKALQIADEAIERKLMALVQAEDRLSATLAMAEGASENDLSRLTDVYEKMKAKDAAALFEEMTPEFSAGFLARMRPEVAANVMAGLTPETAYAISVVLAGRNVGVPTE